MFVRVNQNWDRLLQGIPKYRLEELSKRSAISVPSERTAEAIGRFLNDCGVDLKKAGIYYQQLGGSSVATSMNEVSTNFTGLSAKCLDQLAAHAAWQVHANHAIYWD